MQSVLLRIFVNFSRTLKVSQEDSLDKEATTATKSKWRGVTAVLGGFFVHLTLGNFFTLGNLSPYMISYIRNRVDPNVTHSVAIWINALAYTGQGSCMVFGGMLERKIGTRPTCLIGCLLFCGFIASAFFTIKFGFIALAVSYGLASCIGLGVAYISVLALGMRWFPKRKGLVNGIILSGYGLGALVFNPIQTSIVNPHNIRINGTDGYFTDPEILDAVPHLFLYMAVIYGSIQLISICLLFPVNINKSQSQIYLVNISQNSPHLQSESEVVKNSEPESSAPKLSSAPPAETGPPSLKEISPRRIFEYKEFYLIWFTFAIHCQAIQFINTYYKTFGETIVKDDHFLSIVGSIAGIFNCLGRIFFGILQDKTCYKFCMLIISAGMALLMATFTLTNQGGKGMFMVWVLAIFFLFSGIFSLMATVTSEAFGQKHAGANFGIVFTAPAIMAVIGAPIIGFLLQKVNWLGTCCTLAGLNALGFIITLFVPRNMESVRRKA